MGVFKAASSMVLSIILGAIAMAYLALRAPDFYDTLIGYGRVAESSINNMGLDQAYVNVIGFLITEQQMVFLGLVILLRIIMAALMAAVGSMLGNNRY